MAKNKINKQTTVSKYIDLLKNAKAIYFVKPVGINANQSSQLKMKLSSVNATLSVVKNTLFKRALSDSGYTAELLKQFDGNENAVVFANADITSPAKELKSFAMDTKKIELLAGYFDNKMYSTADVLEIAELPDKNGMIARTMSMFNAPISSFVRALDAISKK